MNWLLSLLTSIGVYAPAPPPDIQPVPEIFVPARSSPPPAPKFPACTAPPAYAFGGMSVVIAIGTRQYAREQASDFRLDMQAHDPMPSSLGQWPWYDRTPQKKRISLWSVHTTTMRWRGDEWATVVTGLPTRLAVEMCLWLQRDCDTLPSSGDCERPAWVHYHDELKRRGYRRDLWRRDGKRTCILFVEGETEWIEKYAPDAKLSRVYGGVRVEPKP